MNDGLLTSTRLPCCRVGVAGGGWAAARTRGDRRNTRLLSRARAGAAAAELARRPCTSLRPPTLLGVPPSSLPSRRTPTSTGFLRCTILSSKLLSLRPPPPRTAAPQPSQPLLDDPTGSTPCPHPLHALQVHPPASMTMAKVSRRYQHAELGAQARAPDERGTSAPSLCFSARRPPPTPAGPICGDDGAPGDGGKSGFRARRRHHRPTSTQHALRGCRTPAAVCAREARAKHRRQ